MKTILTILAIIFSLSAFTQIRNTNWGMTMEEVKKIDTSRLIYEYYNKLTYLIEIEGMKGQVAYKFNKDSLVEIRYKYRPQVFVVKSKNQNAIWIKIFNNLKDQYGKPKRLKKEKSLTWFNKNYSVKAVHVSNKIHETVLVIYTPLISN